MRNSLTFAIKNKQVMEKTCLRTVIGNIQNKATRLSVEINDNLCFKEVKDAISGNCETLKYRENQVLVDENAFLSKFLPKMMTESEIRTVIENSGLKGMPSIMKYLSANYAGLFDGKVAKSIALKQ